jgi:hypothetical protein
MRGRKDGRERDEARKQGKIDTTRYSTDLIA